MPRVGDYALIDISKLDIGGNYKTLNEIDTFTMKYTKEEIIDAIKRSNLVSEEYIHGSLVIADNQKHNPLKVIDKEFYNNFRIDEVLIKCINNKELLNNILNKFLSISKDNIIYNEFKNSLLNKNLEEAIDILFNLPYFNLRKYIIYLIEMDYNKRG